MPSPSRIRDRLAGAHILVTGATGFLAKVFVEKLLRSVDTIGGIHLLVRSRADGASATDRVRMDVLGSRAFDRLRALLGEGFRRLCDAKVHVVSGDLTQERMGLDPSVYADLARRISLVVNSAATVTFDEQLDLAVELNSLGPQRLLALARDCGNKPLLHVSTCYVCGVRSGVIVEDFSAPERARESLPRRPESGEFDLDRIVQSMCAEAAELRARHGGDTESARKDLIDAGMRIARSHGWNDTYTFTKWIGEQLLVRQRGEVPLVVFRPAIIEGSLDEPAPGWIDGLRMADPIIVAYGRGKLRAFPGSPDVAIDLIPADLVANAMIASLPIDAPLGSVAVVQCSSSDRNPLLLRDMLSSLEEAFRQRPMAGEDGKPIHPGRLNLVPRERFVSQWGATQRRLKRYQTLTQWGMTRRRRRKLAAAARQIDQILYFAKIYAPYTQLSCRFADDGLAAIRDGLVPDDQAKFPFDVKRIDWSDYIVNRHVPGLRSFVLGSDLDPAPRIAAAGDWPRSATPVSEASLRGESLFDVFARSAAAMGAKPALQVRRGGRWLRYTYRDALAATGAIMQRFHELGLRAGDCVAICGESSPEWGLTYLAAMGSGLIAAPLDPQLPPTDLWAAADFVSARLVCASPSVFQTLHAESDRHSPVVVMREPWIPPPAASRDAAPPAAKSAGIASILFTSGTTVVPKAVRLSHANFIANATALLQVHPIYDSDEFLSVLPMYHAFEFTAGFLVPLACGSTITYLDAFNAAELTSAMQATGTTVMMVVPRLLRMFHDSIENQLAVAGPIRRAVFRTFGILSRATGCRLGRALFAPVHKRFGGRLRMFVSGGSRLDGDLFDAFRRMGFAIYEGYGLTETAPVLTVNPPGRAKVGSVGPALPNLKLQIHSPNSESVGEVWAKGPSVMQDYHNAPEATADVLVEGWLRTGDLGRIDAEGYLYLTGRSKDLIISEAGKNVYPDEIEARYHNLPHTKELCVFGMPSGDGVGDVIHAVVVIDQAAVPELDRSTIERAIRDAVTAVSSTLPSHQRISAMHFWDRELPKTSTLKAKRGVVREMVRAEGLTPRGRPTGATATASAVRPNTEVSSPGASALFVVQRLLAQQCKRPASAIQPDMHLLLDLGIDSIGKIDVLGAVEDEFDLRIDDLTGAKIARVSDLLAVVGHRSPIVAQPRAARRLLPLGAAAEANGHPPAAVVPLRWAAAGLGTALMHSYVRVRTVGRDNVPRSGPFILAPNHTSHLDALSVKAAVGRGRRIWVAGAEDYFFNNRLKRFLFGEVLDTIAFDRQADGQQGLRRCADVLRRGDGLIFFPEGTRSLTGRLQPFKIGVGVLAVESGAPVVPVFIDHAFRLFPKGRRIPRPGTVTVTFGSPIRPKSRDATADLYTTCRDTAEAVERALAALGGVGVRA